MGIDRISKTQVFEIAKPILLAEEMLAAQHDE
jgi:hypothetical protein